jgi:hypothetical protein
MIDLQTAVEALMTLVLSNGADAAKALFKGMVVKGAEQASEAWRRVFEREPEAYPLADRVARNPEDTAQAQALRDLLERVLAEHSELLPPGGLTVRTGDIQADRGSVGAGVIQGSTLHITNQK